MAAGDRRLAAAEQRNIAKAALLYDFIDSSDFYVNPVEKADRSRMNVRSGWPITISRLISGGRYTQSGGAEGHRSVGMRASLYNAMPIEGVQALVDHGRVRGDEGLKRAMTEKYRVRVLNHISAAG